LRNIHTGKSGAGHAKPKQAVKLASPIVEEEKENSLYFSERVPATSTLQPQELSQMLHAESPTKLLSPGLEDLTSPGIGITDKAMQSN